MVAIVPNADLVHRPSQQGTEDFVFFRARPAREELVYDVDVSHVAGLRLVSSTLEFLDASGAPRLRISPPWVSDASGRRAAELGVEGCAFDTSPAGPWGRGVTGPGAASCVVRVRWSDVAYPAVVDPSWVATGALANPRHTHTATVLTKPPLVGKILMTGGMASTPVLRPPVSAGEIYDPDTGTFAATGSLVAARLGHTATVLTTGPSKDSVLIVGGGNAESDDQIDATGALASVELYDPATGNYTNTTKALGTARLLHTATVLPGGKVLIAGGGIDGAGGVQPMATAEVLDPATLVFTPTQGPMSAARLSAAAFVPATGPRAGKVLVAGGTDASGTALSSTEGFDPATGTFLPGPTMAGVSYGQPGGQPVAPLPNGDFLVGGGGLYRATTDTFATASLLPPQGNFSEPTVAVTLSKGVTAAVRGANLALVAPTLARRDVTFTPSRRLSRRCSPRS